MGFVEENTCNWSCIHHANFSLQTPDCPSIHVSEGPWTQVFTPTCLVRFGYVDLRSINEYRGSCIPLQACGWNIVTQQYSVKACMSSIREDDLSTVAPSVCLVRIYYFHSSLWCIHTQDNGVHNSQQSILNCKCGLSICPQWIKISPIKCSSNHSNLLRGQPLTTKLDRKLPCLGVMLCTWM